MSVERLPKVKWVRHKVINDDDFKLLRGSPSMEKLQKNRLVFTLDPNDTHPSTKELGLYETKGLVYIRNLSGRKDTVEVMFEKEEDLEMLEQYLTQYKMIME